MRRFKMTIPESVFLASIIIAFGVVFMAVSTSKKEEIKEEVLIKKEPYEIKFPNLTSDLDEIKNRLFLLEKRNEPVVLKMAEPISITVEYKEKPKRPLLPKHQPPIIKPLVNPTKTPMLDRAMESLHRKKK